MILAVVDATAAIGPGDRTVLARAVQQVHAGRTDDASTASRRGGPGCVIVVNKIDRASPSRLLERLAEAKEALDALGEVPGVEYFPVSARTGEGVEELTAYLIGVARRRDRPSSPPTS